jgi:hypothetical protein
LPTAIVNLSLIKNPNGEARLLFNNATSKFRVNISGASAVDVEPLILGTGSYGNTTPPRGRRLSGSGSTVARRQVHRERKQRRPRRLCS